MQLVTADGQLFLELHQGCLSDVRITELLLVTLGIVVHGLLQGLGNADVVDNQAPFLPRENTVYTSNGLHQVMSAHGLEHIHGGERRNIKSREPHIAYDSYLHRIVIVLELTGQFLLVGFGADDVLPLFGVLVAGGHHHLYLLLPFGAEFQHLLVYLDAHATGQRHNHGLPRQVVGTVFFVMGDDVTHQRIDGGIATQHLLQSAHFLLGTHHLLVRSTGFEQGIKFRIKLAKNIVVQVKLNHTALVVHRTGSPILHGLRHVVDVDVVSEYFGGILITVRDGRPRKADERSVRKCFTHLQGLSLLHGFGLGVPMLIPILATVCFVGHYNDVLAERKRFFAFLKLLYGGKDDASTLAVLQ